MRELSSKEVAERSTIYLTSAVQFPGKPPAPGPISASIGLPNQGKAPGRPPAPAAAPGAECSGDPGETFCDKVADLQHHRQLSRAQAIKAAATERPDLHKRHLDRVSAQADNESFQWTYVTENPKNFSEAINLCLGLGFPPREAVAEAARRYPELHQERQARLAKLLR